MVAYVEHGRPKGWSRTASPRSVLPKGRTRPTFAVGFRGSDTDDDPYQSGRDGRGDACRAPSVPTGGGTATDRGDEPAGARACYPTGGGG